MHKSLAIRSIPVNSSPTANPWNSCQHEGHDDVQNFHPAACSKKWAGLAVFVCVAAPAPASCSSVVSTHPLSSPISPRETRACCHSAQAPQRLRFPLGLTEVLAVSHIVGIQHQPVYWSPCGFSLSLSLSFSPSTTHLLYGVHTQHSYKVLRQYILLHTLHD